MRTRGTGGGEEEEVSSSTRKNGQLFRCRYTEPKHLPACYYHSAALDILENMGPGEL